jgi:ABC-2 type transport system ATP-binding protein
MLQRLGLAQALIADPKLVLLDEPTDGVDPVGRREIRDLLVRMRGEGRTVIVNSHILSEIELVCDEIAVLNGGRVVHRGSVEDLVRHEGEWELLVSGGPADLGARIAEHAEFVLPRDGGFVVKTRDDAAIDRVVDAVRAAGASLRGLGPRKATLEDRVVELLRRETAQGGAP